MPLSPILILPALLLLSLLTLTLGRRGRRIDDHPLCRKCGFDLTGRPDGSFRCAECGADLRRRRAIRIGNRTSSRPLVWLGMVCLFVSIAGSSTKFWWYRPPVLQPYLPTWWLAHEINAGEPDLRAAALQELVRRLDAGLLTQGQIDGLADRALEHQADRATPWIAEWGQFVQAAQMKSQLTLDRWQRYVDQSIHANLHVRPAVRYSWLYPVEAYVIRDRCVPPLSGKITWRFNHPIGVLEGQLDVGYVGVSTLGTALLNVAVPTDNLTAGEYKVVLDLDTTVEGSSRVATRQLERAVQVLPEWSEPVRLSTDPAMKRTVSEAILLRRAELRTPNHETWFADFAFDIDPAPIGLVGELILRVDGNEQRLREMIIPPAGGLRDPGKHRITETVSWQDPTVRTADIVFRPAPMLAETTMDVLEIWGEEIAFRNIDLTAKIPTQGAGAGP